MPQMIPVSEAIIHERSCCVPEIRKTFTILPLEMQGIASLFSATAESTRNAMLEPAQWQNNSAPIPDYVPSDAALRMLPCQTITAGQFVKQLDL